MSIDLHVATGAQSMRPVLFTQGARALSLARFRRRARLLACEACAILSLRKGARALALAAWAYLGAAAWLFAQPGQLGWNVAPSLVLFACLGVASLIDARYFILPDGPLAALAIVGVAMRLTWADFSLSSDFLSSLAAAAFAFGLFRVVSRSFEKWRGYPGLGEGDARLFALAGLWLGWLGLPTCLLVATLSAAFSAAIAQRDGVMSLDSPMPFGPHLTLGFWICWAIGPLVG